MDILRILKYMVVSGEFEKWTARMLSFFFPIYASSHVGNVQFERHIFNNQICICTLKI